MGIDAWRKIRQREFRRARGELRFGDELTEILVTLARRDEQGDHTAVFHRDLGTDAGLDGEPIFVGAAVKSRRAIDPIAIEQGDGREFSFQSRLDQIFGQGSPAEETEGAAGVELGVAHGVRWLRVEG
jgi:hypothetical protein